MWWIQSEDCSICAAQILQPLESRVVISIDYSWREREERYGFNLHTRNKWKLFLRDVYWRLLPVSTPRLLNGGYSRIQVNFSSIFLFPYMSKCTPSENAFNRLPILSFFLFFFLYNLQPIVFQRIVFFRLSCRSVFLGSFFLKPAQRVTIYVLETNA